MGTIDITSQAEVTVAIQMYFNQLQANKIQLSTISKYRQCLKTFQEWLGDRIVSEQAAKEFLGLLRQQGFKESTISIYYHALKPFLEYIGILLRVKCSRVQNPPAYYSADNVRAILKVINQRQDRWSKLTGRDRTIILTFAYTGIRRAELLSLRVKDINFQNHEIRVKGKGSKERVIPLADVLYYELQNYTKNLEVGDYLFPLSPHRLWRIVKNYAEKAGVPDWHPHCFRHYFATQVVQSGESLQVAKELCGHADISTTEIYLHVTAQHLSNAVSKLPNLMEQQFDGMET
jgi:site-specific recombinase XerD